MGRKKKKTTKPWCWYCNREFEDEKILLQHQKAKHFKCNICHKKLFTGPGLQIHCMQVHKESIEKVPNSIKGRDNINLEICGMENIPEEDLIEHEKQKTLHNRDETIDSDSQDSDSSSTKPSSNGSSKQQPQIPYQNIPAPLPPQPPLPPNPLMMHYPGMMMGYPPHMMGMMGMGMNPMMMQHPMMNPMLMQSVMPQGPYPQIPPPPATATTPLSNNPNQPVPLMSQQTQPSQKPPPLMSLTPQPLMATQISQIPPLPTLPPLQKSLLLPVKPLFPAGIESLMQDTQILHPATLVNKIENLPPGTKLIHPEDDISLEEFRASHAKYKYTPPSSSSPAVLNSSTNNGTSNRTAHQSHHHQQHQQHQQLFYQNGNANRY